MTSHNAKNPPSEKAQADKPATWFLTVCELAAKGVSDRSIAARLGLSLAEFDALVNYEYPTGVYKVKEAIDLARAEFEIARVEMKDQLLMDPETSPGLKIKIIRDDLKTLEAWAPAVRTVTVKVEQAPTEFSFESFSDEEQAKIVAAATASDTFPELAVSDTDNDTNGNAEE